MRPSSFLLLTLTVVPPLTSCQSSQAVEESGSPPAAETASQPRICGDELLDILGERAFRWFLDNAHPVSGLVRDRALNPFPSGHPTPSSDPGAADRRRNMASIASSGYFLSALPNAVSVGLVQREDAIAYCRRHLHFILERLDHHHGLLYHFVHWETGERWAQCEISLLDSAILFNGCMVVAVAFGGEVETLVDRLLDRVEWSRFVLPDRRNGKLLLSLGWKPEQGLLSPADVRSSEMAMAYFLAAGARRDPVSPQLWYNTRVTRGALHGRELLNVAHPLFTSYYGLGWHDLEGLADLDGVDLFENARRAALANREFCRALARRFPIYGEGQGGWWGVSAGDSPRGYVARGPVLDEADGMVWPVAALATLPSIPEVVRGDLEVWSRSEWWSSVSGEYGIAPFNPSESWVGSDLIGIDLGSFYLSLANHRRRTVWDLWKQHPIAKNALERLGYRGEASPSR